MLGLDNPELIKLSLVLGKGLLDGCQRELTLLNQLLVLRQEPFLKSACSILHLSHLTIRLDFQNPGFLLPSLPLLISGRLTRQLEPADLFHLGDSLLDPLPRFLEDLCLGGHRSPLAKPRQLRQFLLPFRPPPRCFRLPLGLLLRSLLLFAPDDFDLVQVKCLGGGQSELELEPRVVVLGRLLGPGRRLERLVAEGADREPAHPDIGENGGQPGWQLVFLREFLLVVEYLSFET